MNRPLLLLLVIGASAAASELQAQGTVFLSNYDSHAGIYEAGPAPVGTFVEIFGGPGIDSWVPLVNSSGQGPVFVILPSGVDALGPGTGSFFNAGQASVPGVAPGGLGWFQALAWYGAPGWGQAFERTGAFWSQKVGSADNPAPLLMPRLDLLIPEPTTAALAGLALAIVGFRRWHKRSWNTASK